MEARKPPFIATQAPSCLVSQLCHMVAWLHLKIMEILIGEIGGAPLRQADMTGRPGLDVRTEEQVAGTAAAHLLHGQTKATPIESGSQGGASSTWCFSMTEAERWDFSL
jgi:hypothetical protein